MKNKCKAIILLSAIILVLILMYFGIYSKKGNISLLFDKETMQITMILPSGQEVYGWEKEGVVHYFVPSYVSTDSVKILGDATQLILNGNVSSSILYDELCKIDLCDEANNLFISQNACFHHSQNLYTMNIELYNQDIDDIDKENFSEASIAVINPKGKVQYFGEGDRIKGRGNSTWHADKKPYSLKLEKRSSLCNLNPSRSWSLITNSFEGTKLASKVMYDFSNDIGMEYKVDTEWVDLYINGEYRGNYLLCEKIEVAQERLNINNLQSDNDSLFDKLSCEQIDEGIMKGYATYSNPQDITGGYILEKDVSGYYVSEPCGFITDRGACFTMTSPNNATIEEVEYMRNFVQQIDNYITTGDKRYLNYIDVDSFIKRYLLEELAFNSDAYATSCYFYKRSNEDRLYAGPIWDYDGTFGESNGDYLNYNESVLHQQEFINPEEVLDWDVTLLSDQEYFEHVKSTYLEIYPQIMKLLNNKIDSYAEKIRVSVALDSIRWNYGEMKAGHYSSFDNNIRYMKFFLKQRINLLNEKFGIEERFSEESTGICHKLYCVYEDQIYEFDVMDGDYFKEIDLPEYDNNIYSGWCYQRDNLFFCEYLPVFEDVVLIPNKRG